MPSYTIPTGLAILIVFSPLAVGSVYIVTYSAMELIVFGLLLVHIWTSDFSRLKTGYFFQTFLLMMPMMVFLLFGLVQLVPLPAGLLKSLAPGNAAVYQRLGMLASSEPLTLSIYGTTIALLKWSAYLGAFFLAATFSPSRQLPGGGRRIEILVLALAFIGFAEAIYGLYIYLQGGESLLWFERTAYKDSVAGTYINRNHLAGFLNMCILVTLGLLISRAGRSGGHRGWITGFTKHMGGSRRAAFLYLMILGLLTMMLGVIFSLSRMGQFSLAIGLVVMAVLYGSKGMKHSSFLILVFVCLGLLWGAWKGLDPVGARWKMVENELFEGRMVLWRRSWDLFRDHWLTGTGFGTFELAFPPYKAARHGAELYDHAHCDYLEILSETGILGFIPWLTFFISFLAAAIRKWGQRHDSLVRGVGAGGIAATVTMMCHSLADFNLQIPANALILFIIMGLTWRTLMNSPKAE